MQNQASILLLLEIDSMETRGIIPGKVFEYFAAKRPILAIGPKNWEAGNMVRDTQSGNYFLFSNKNEIKSWILDQFKRQQTHGFEKLNSDIFKFHRRELTRELADLIERI